MKINQLETWPKQTQYKPNFIRHSLGEGGTNPIPEKPKNERNFYFNKGL